MEIFLILFLILLVIFFILKKVFNSAKKNLFKDQEAWSGKDLKIKYRKSEEIPESKSDYNYLKIISDESKIFLDDQSKQEIE
tara:strand:- start:1015 stop:1260 length:246 start_codon:yes stop_codon:yes gene_type:complete